MSALAKASLNQKVMDRFIVQKSGLTREDIAQIVAIHRAELSQGFLTSLGDTPLKLILSFATTARSAILMAVRDTQTDSVCGFLLGTFNTRKFYREFLLKKSVKATVLLAPRMISFQRVRRLLETLIYPSNKEMSGLPDAELLDIAVARDYQGSGLAKLLFHNFSGILADRGVKEFRITTGESLTGAQRFYEALGAQRSTTIELHKGKKTIVYCYEIPDAASTERIGAL